MFGFRLVLQRRAIFVGELFADGDQIVARIKALRNVADGLAERLAVAQEGRAREHIDLRAGVVDIIFARHIVTGEHQQIGERIAEHRTTTVTDVHRAGRIGGDVFDVDLFVRTHCRATVVGAAVENDAQFLAPDVGLERQIDEARTGDVNLGHQRFGAQCLGNGVGQFARLLAGVFRQHHRGVGRHVAVARIARRLDHDARQIGLAGQRRGRRAHARKHGGEQVLGGFGSGHDGLRVRDFGGLVKGLGLAYGLNGHAG